MASSLLHLLLLLPAASLAGAGVAVRGIPRSLEALYSAARFSCLDGSRTLEAARVNDDYCDCADGSDEPGTSACAQGRFYCANKGYRGKHVTSALVNDGVCDCCDGSDEWLQQGRASACPDTCDVDGAAWRQHQAEIIRAAEEGARNRQLYEAEGMAQASARASKIESLTAQAEAARLVKEAAETVRKMLLALARVSARHAAWRVTRPREALVARRVAASTDEAVRCWA